MNTPIEDMTPSQTVAELDKYIVGQNAAKRAVAVALRNRYRRQQLPIEERDDIQPKNILMIGPTGVGKTEIARRLASLARAPFIKVEATKFTEVGYVGRDVESMVRDLVAAAVRLVEREVHDEYRAEALDNAIQRIAGLIDPEPWPTYAMANYAAWDETAEIAEVPDHDEMERQEQERQEKRAALIEEIKNGSRDKEMIEFDLEQASSPFLQVFTPQGMEEMGLDMANLPGGGTKSITRKVTVEVAKRLLVEEEVKKLVDSASIHQEAVERAEQSGIIFIDEIDKVAGKSGGSGPDVSREGVQRDLLPIIEGSTVQTKFGPVRTDHVLFIAAGAFHISKPSDLIPELQGRLPIRVELESLTESDFRRILFEPRNALTRQYERLLGVEGVSLSFTPDGLDTIARFATEVNKKIENIGARRLHTMMERLLEDILFAAPEHAEKSYQFDAAAVEKKLGPFLANIPERANVL